MVFVVVITLIYSVCYFFVVANSQFFLTEYSSTSTVPQTSNSSGSNVAVRVSESAADVVTHWGWLNYAHEKYVLNLMLFLVSIYVCSYFRPVSSSNVAKGDTVQKVRQGLIKRKIENAFAVFGLWLVFWSLSLNFVPVTPFDSILSLIVVFVAVGLLASLGVYLFVKTARARKTRINVGSALTVSGMFLAVWFVVKAFLDVAFFPLLCLSVASLIILFFIGKFGKKVLEKIVEDIG
jgi:hypothetical protein